VKKFLLLALIAAALLLMTGCVFSISPLYTAADLVFDPSLVGIWDQDGKAINTWTFEKAGESSYRLVVAEGERSSPFVAHLVQLGGHRFLDVSPDKSGLAELKQTELYKASLIRSHLFLKVVQIQPVLQMTLMDDDWLGKLLQKDPNALAHQEEEGGTLVLTASTKALQDFMVQHWSTEGAWSKDLSNMKRR
jgi:hypothetical protein